MSTAADEAGEVEGPRAQRRSRALQGLALLAALAALSALFMGERARIADDLQLFAESAARPGEQLALRALVLRDVDGLAGPRLDSAAVRVRLLDPDGRELARTQLVATRMDSMEGALRVPDIARGRLRLEASVRDHDGPPLQVSRSLTVGPAAEAASPVSRLAGPLQHFALGRVKTLGTAQAPSPLLPRVVAGTCVPEQLCRLLVWVGEPAAAIELTASASVTPVGRPVPATETDGLVGLDLRVHGAEAEVTLRAVRGGKGVAERAVRLPVALGETRVATDRSLVPARSAVALSLTPPPGREHVIVDTFVAGRWTRSSTAHAVANGGAVPLALLPDVTGLVRVQARTDRYSGEASGTRVIYVQRPGESSDEALASVARAAREAGVSEGATDGLEHVRPPTVRGDAERWAAFVLAPFELVRMPIPLAVSGRPAQVARVERSRTLVRFSVGAMLVCCAFVVGASLLRRGLSAADEAGAILDEAGENTGLAPVSRYAERLRVVIWVTLVCMAFLAAALLIVAKPLWF